MPAAVGTDLPAFQPHSAAEDRPFLTVRLIDDRDLRRAGVLGAELDRLGKEPGPAANRHLDRPPATRLSLPLANDLLGCAGWLPKDRPSWRSWARPAGRTRHRCLAARRTGRPWAGPPLPVRPTMSVRPTRSKPRTRPLFEQLCRRRFSGRVRATAREKPLHCPSRFLNLQLFVLCRHHVAQPQLVEELVQNGRLLGRAVAFRFVGKQSDRIDNMLGLLQVRLRSAGERIGH